MPSRLSQMAAYLKDAAQQVASDERTGKVLSSYGRRLLEGTYDNLVFDTEIGRRILRMSPKGKLAGELALYIVGAMATAKLPENNPLQVLFKDLLEDAPSELAGRVISGPKHFDELLECLFSSMEKDPEFRSDLRSYFEQGDQDARARIIAVLRRSAIAPVPHGDSGPEESHKPDPILEGLQHYRAQFRAKRAAKAQRKAK